MELDLHYYKILCLCSIFILAILIISNVIRLGSLKACSINPVPLVICFLNPPERDVSCNLRNVRNYDQNSGRTARYSNTYFQNATFEWNLLDAETRNLTSISKFKRELFVIIRPDKKLIYGTIDIAGVRHLSKL